jgi:Ni/Co efflux regulator RcnB
MPVPPALRVAGDLAQMIDLLFTQRPSRLAHQSFRGVSLKMPGVKNRMIIRKSVLNLALALTLMGGAAFAQDHPDHPDNPDQHAQYVHHPEWKKGYHMQSGDWGRGTQVDWNAHHLHKPPAGYEWRLIDGNYVCANSDGVVFAVVVAQ